MPVFSRERCKRCGICSHFCPAEAIAVDEEGMPYIADLEACTSCGLCSDMCPDWAVYLAEPDREGPGPERNGPDRAGGNLSGPDGPADHSQE